MKEKTSLNFPFKYIFIVLLFCIAYLGIKDTFCDIHVVSAGDKGGMVFMNDTVFEEFKKDMYDVLE